MTKKNIEAKAHWESKHPSSSFDICWPGQFNPDSVVAAAADTAADGASSSAPAVVAAAPKKKKTEDLSFLDAALDKKVYKKK